ncbi:MAG: carboxypeptidase-like regulatory domain-containing protein, partial [Terriglobia bacterium]
MRIRALFVLALGFVVATTLGFISVQRLDAQSLYGSMSGTVTDQSGAVIPGAAITIINQDT